MILCMDPWTVLYVLCIVLSDERIDIVHGGSGALDCMN